MNILESPIPLLEYYPYMSMPGGEWYETGNIAVTVSNDRGRILGRWVIKPKLGWGVKVRNLLFFPNKMPVMHRLETTKTE